MLLVCTVLCKLDNNNNTTDQKKTDNGQTMEDTGRRRLTVKGPTDFTGNPEHSETWSYKFTAYAARTDHWLETLASLAERSTNPITDNDLEDW